MSSVRCPTLKSQKYPRIGRAHWSSFQNARGQAFIEYLLMLVIAVLLLVTLAFGVFKPLGDFVDSLNRKYIQCLLETGELPGLKSGDQKICTSLFPSFSGGSASGPGSGGTGGSGGSKSSDPQNSSNRDGSSGSDSADDGGGGGGGGRSANSSSASRKSSVIRNGMLSRGNASPELGESQSTSIPVDNFNEGNGYMRLNSGGSSSRFSRQKTRQVALAGLTEYDRRKVEKEEQKVVNRTVENESFTTKKNKKITVKPPDIKPKEEELDVGGGFGFYFKIFFIIIILIFIFLLIGGQAFQLSKNWE